MVGRTRGLGLGESNHGRLGKRVVWIGARKRAWDRVLVVWTRSGREVVGVKHWREQGRQGDSHFVCLLRQRYLAIQVPSSN